MCPENSSGAPRTPSGSDILRVVRALVSAVRESSAYPDVLFRICEALTRTVPCDRATIYLASSRRRAFLPSADHGTPAEVVQTFIRRGYSRGAFPGEEELRAGRSVLAVEGETSPAFEEVLTLVPRDRAGGARPAPSGVRVSVSRGTARRCSRSGRGCRPPTARAGRGS